MTTRSDSFEAIDDLTAVRGGQCDGVCGLERHLCRGTEAGANAGIRPLPPEPVQPQRFVRPRMLEAEF